ALSRCRAKRIYVWFGNWDRDYARIPSRESFKWLYKVLMQKGNWKQEELVFPEPTMRKLGLSDGIIRFMLEVFQELEFIEKRADGSYAKAASPQKRDLSEATAYQKRES